MILHSLNMGRGIWDVSPGRAACPRGEVSVSAMTLTHSLTHQIYFGPDCTTRFVMDLKMQPSILLLEKLPRPWIGCLTALQSHNGVLKNLEQWLRSVEQSKQDGHLSWQDLLTCLSQDEPSSNDQGLYFIPLLLHLPPAWQSYLLCFIHRHRQQITLHTLVQFLDSIEHRLNEVQSPSTDASGSVSVTEQHDSARIKDEQYDENDTKADSCHWTKFWINELQIYVQYSGVNRSDSENIKRKLPNGSKHYKFSTMHIEQKNRILNLCDPETAEQNPWSTRVLVKERQSHGSLDHSMSQLQSPAVPGHPLDISMFDPDTPDLPLSKKMKHNISVFDNSENSQNSSQSQLENGIPAHFMENIKCLRDSWHSDSADVKCDDLNMFTQCPVDVIEQMCDMLELSTLPEGNLATVVMAISSLKEQLPLSHAAVIAQHCLLNKVLSLSGSASRHIQQACVSLTEAYPAAVISSVLTPTLLSSQVGTHQCDVIIMLLRDTIDTDHKYTLIRAYVEQRPKVLIAVLPLLQHIVDTKTVLEDKTLSGLVSVLSSSSADYTTNLKFGKLVLGLVKQYNKQLTSNHVTELDQALAGHTTFLKKSILVVLKKVSKS